MIDDFIDFYILPILFMGALLAVIIGLVMGLTWGVSRPVCFRTAEAMEVEARWGFWEGCLLQNENGRWLPDDIYRTEID